MQARKLSRARTIAALTLTLIALGGCLSQEDDEAGLTAADQPLAENSAPDISGNPAASVNIGEDYLFAPVASDSDGDLLTFSVENLPTWATFDTADGALFGRPTLGDVGLHSDIRISVSDGQLNASLPAFSIEVLTDNTNSPPVITGSPAPGVTAGIAYSFTPTASDADGDMLTFGISGQPGWASFSSVTGTLSGTPDNGDAGMHSNIRISVSDGQETSSLPAFSIEVVAVVTNSPPTISGTPAPNVSAGVAYSFTPVANDPDGDALTFSITNRPPWLSFDASTGRLSGVPGDSDVGVHGGISISVSDSAASAMLGPFAIEVLAVVTNSPPTISGAPAPSVNANDAYSFTPVANDPDGDTLTFSIVNMPGWASFDASTGQLSGTPTDADVGSYDNIEITVSDGQESATLEPFSLTVNAVSPGSVTLSWTAPTQNEDGSALTNLAGYKIYWGTSPGTYPDEMTIDNPGQTTAVIDNLVPGTYEFVATSFNDVGVESQYSNPVTKVVP